MAGIMYQCALHGYNGIRMAKNFLLNQVDRPVIVLVYHRVTSLLSDPQMLAVTPANFRSHLSYLKNTLPIVRLEDDWSTVKKPAVAITFDDGYADNALEALPIIEEVGVPATFFVTTGMIGTNRMFWWDELESVICGNGSFSDRFALADENFRRDWPTVTAAERKKLYEEIHPLMKSVDAVRRDDWLAQLRQWAQKPVVSTETHRSMSLDELRRLAGSRWATIGAHTITHVPLSYQPPTQQKEEITESKRQLEAWLGKDTTVFSYPFGGKTDFSSVSVEFCRDAGFVKAVANFPGQAHRWTDPCRLPRQVVRNWNINEFAHKMKKFMYE